MDLLGPLMPKKYAPLQATGDGKQAVYLTEIPVELAGMLMQLIGNEAAPLSAAAKLVKPIIADDLDSWERKLEKAIVQDRSIPETDRLAIVRARIGQGLFKERVSEIEKRCRITGVENPVHLIASHCKPWRDSNNDERLDGENGLLLTPSIDRLFDRGFISFEDQGRLMVSPVADRSSLQKMGVETSYIVNVGAFSEGQRTFLDFHRNSVFLQAQGKISR
jgi:predicted restriction endonuclease